MKTLSKILLTLMLVAVVVAVGIAITTSSDAATSNPAPGSAGYEIIVLPISSITTTTPAIVKLTAPWPIRLGCAYAVSNTVGGTVQFDVVNASGVSLLTSKITASTVTAEGTLLTAPTPTLNITDESTISISSSGSGSAQNSTITLCTKRL